MEESKYSVFLTGEIIEGNNLEIVKAKLAKLFDSDILTIGEILQRKDIIIKKNIDEKTAEKYAHAIKSAGAVSIIKNNESISGFEKTKLKENKTADGPVIISVRPMSEKAQYSHHGCNKITGWAEGLNLNRKDITEISFQNILCVSAFKLFDNEEAKIKLMLFLKKDKRPYLLDAHLINYQSFPLPKTVNMLSSLRNFIFFICKNNRSIIIDKGTFDFLSGKQPYHVESAILTFSSGIGQKIFSGEKLSSEIDKSEIEKVFD